MAFIGRRGLLRATAAAALGGALVAPASARAATDSSAGADDAAPKARPPEPVTHIVARYAASTTAGQILPAVGGSRLGAPSHAVAALLPFSGPPRASLSGRRERFDPLNAALINGISSHVLDFDDTHLKTIIHPAGPVASALTAWAEVHPVSGAAFMTALVIGCEIECRIGNSVFPEHYAEGWHITGTTGVFGAAVAIGRLLGLDEQHMAWALGLAASQPVGLKVQFGSDTKSFHPGRAAQNGMMSALLAQQGFTASEVAIEGFDRWGQAMSTRHDWSQITEGLGIRYELALNTYKPFACGIVSNPAIDAAIQLRDANGIKPDDIKSIEKSSDKSSDGNYFGLMPFPRKRHGCRVDDVATLVANRRAEGPLVAIRHHVAGHVRKCFQRFEARRHVVVENDALRVVSKLAAIVRFEEIAWHESPKA